MKNMMRRPTPATVIALVALGVALGGTATGATVLLNGSRIKKATIPGNRLKRDSVTGKQIKESSLGNVPKATNAINATHAGTADSATNAANAGHAGTADSATNAATAANANSVGGVTVRKVFYAPATATSTSTPILSLGGLTLNASCNGGNVAILIKSAVDHADFTSEMYNSGGGGQADGLHHTDFNTTNSDDLTDNNSWGETSFTYTTPDGTIDSGQISFESSNFIGSHIFNDTAACLVSGLVMSTAAS